MLTSLRDQLAAQQFEFGGGAQGPYVVTQLGGANVNLPDFLGSRHPVTTRDEAEAYLSRLSGFARALDQESTMIADDAGRGMIPPDFAIDGAVNQLNGFASTAPAQNVLVTSLRGALPEVAEIPEADRAGFMTRAETIVRDEVLPAYRRQIEALRAIRPRATHDAGIGAPARRGNVSRRAARLHDDDHERRRNPQYGRRTRARRPIREMDAMLRAKASRAARWPSACARSVSARISAIRARTPAARSCWPTST